MPDEKHYEPPCRQCIARCCRQEYTGWPFAVELVAEDSDRFDEYAVYNATVNAYVLPYNEHGVCHYLTEDNRCRIHEHRPQTCRAFDCTRGNIIFVSRNPELLLLLEEKGMAQPKDDTHADD